MSHAAGDGRIRFDDQPLTRVDVAIIGGGFSGLATAIGVLERVTGARVAVFERHPRPCPGVAYGGCESTHLLNVRADRMGAHVDDPTGFSRWLATHLPGRYANDDFVPRSLYGRYLNETIARGLEPHRDRLALVEASVDRLSKARGGTRLSIRNAAGVATEVQAGLVVLALGLPSTPPAWPGERAAEAIRDPWAEDAFAGIDRDDPLVIIGTGLTALDVLVSLATRDHRGPITFVSRNGRFPLPHSKPRPGVKPLTLSAEELRTPRLAFRASRTRGALRR